MTLWASVRAISEGVAQMAATVQELAQELDQILTRAEAANVLTADLKAQIAVLQAQVGSGIGVTQADLDALDVKADAILVAQGVVPVVPVVPPLDQV